MYCFFVILYFDSHADYSSGTFKNCTSIKGAFHEYSVSENFADSRPSRRHSLVVAYTVMSYRNIMLAHGAIHVVLFKMYVSWGHYSRLHGLHLILSVAVCEAGFAIPIWNHDYWGQELDHSALPAFRDVKTQVRFRSRRCLDLGVKHALFCLSSAFDYFSRSAMLLGSN